MTDRIAFSVPGRPRGKERPRASGRVVMVDDQPTAVVSLHTARETRQAEKAVLDTFRALYPRHQPYTGPVKLSVIAVFPIPASWPNKLVEAARAAKVWHVARGQLDLDNAVKLVSDALNEHAWVDDAQVAVITAGKRYGKPERIEVMIEPLDQPDVPATPGQRRLEALPPAMRVKPHTARKSNRTKSGSQPTALDLAIAAALQRDEQGGNR